MLSRCTNLGSATMRQQLGKLSQRMRVIALLHQGIGTSRKNVNAYSEIFSRCFVAKNTVDPVRTFSEVHQSSKWHRHIGDTSAMFQMCSCKHRQCIFDVICDGSGDASPIYVFRMPKDHRPWPILNNTSLTASRSSAD